MLVPPSTSVSGVVMCQFFNDVATIFIINKLHVSNSTMLSVIPSFSFPASSLRLSRTPHMAPVSTSLPPLGSAPNLSSSSPTSATTSNKLNGHEKQSNEYPRFQFSPSFKSPLVFLRFCEL